MSQKKSRSQTNFSERVQMKFLGKKLQKFAKFRPLTSDFGGSIPGGWAGVFRRKTREKTLYVCVGQRHVFETEREAREYGGLGA